MSQLLGMHSLLPRFSKSAVDFLLQFLYGGLTCVPEEVDVWELAALADQLRLDLLLAVVELHLRTHKCHFFHRVGRRLSTVVCGFWRRPTHVFIYVYRPPPQVPAFVLRT